MKYSVPKHHNERLLVPPREELGDALESNRCLMEAYAFSIGGESFREFRLRAREEALSAAGDEPVVLSAHQPGLLHMGVVEKLRLLQELSGEYDACYIVLDTDEIDVISARIPLLREGSRETREFRLYSSAVPRTIFAIPSPPRGELDGTLSEIAGCLESTAARPVIDAFRRFLRVHEELYAPGADIGSLLAAYRRRFLGYGSIRETRMSAVCRTGAWRDFVRSLADDIEAFSTAYNESLDRFREERKIESPHAPFPDLLRSPEKTELPFWTLKEGGLRAAPFVSRSGELVDEGGERAGDSPILPRAITFTIFARLFLCDLFIHGAGGGNYDRATDMIIKDYFGVEPPLYCVASATIYPELPMDRGIEARIKLLKQRLRDMEQHPEKHADASRAAQLVEEKKKIIGSLEGKMDSGDHLRIKEINAELRLCTADRLEEAERKLRDLERVEEDERPWRRRDYPYFLFGQTPI